MGRVLQCGFRHWAPAASRLADCLLEHRTLGHSSLHAAAHPALEPALYEQSALQAQATSPLREPGRARPSQARPGPAGPGSPVVRSAACIGVGKEKPLRWSMTEPRLVDRRRSRRLTETSLPCSGVSPVPAQMCVAEAGPVPVQMWQGCFALAVGQGPLRRHCHRQAGTSPARRTPAAQSN